MKVIKPLIIIFCLLFAVIILTIVEFYFIKLPSVDITTRLLLTGILTFNTLALLTLMFFVGKNLFRLCSERQHRILGYKFRTKLMAIFVILTLIPSAFLFIAASGLATNYINRIFSPQIKEPFKKSVELARAFYDVERERVLKIAKLEAQKTASYRELKQIYGNSLLVTHYSSLPTNATDTIKDAFNGKEGTEIISKENEDVIRAAVPNHLKGGVVVVEFLLPRTFSEKTEKIQTLYEDYLKLESFKEPLRLNYTLILGFLTLLIVFTGLWVSLKISQGITIPIQSLAMATEKVASGDLNVQVNVKSEDEVGLLINSFNQMVNQLKESKNSLEHAYMESYRRRLYLENILENINSGVIFLDNTGSILTINRSACSILNISQEEVIGRNYKEFISSLHSEDLSSMVKDIEGREIHGIKREVKININGKMLTLIVYISGIRESFTSRSLGMLVVFDDITDIIQAQKVITWQEIARRLAHEIKNPLTPIKLSTERLIKKWQQKDHDFDDVFKKSTNTIIREVESLKRLVDVFSRYGRMPELTKAPTNLTELIDDAASLYKGFKDLRINVVIQDKIPIVNIDPEQIKRVLINIIDNAIKAMDNTGAIDIYVRIDENRIIIDIADTGPGISNEEKEKLFIPYFSKRKDGTGLGLAIAHKIISDHGGKILVRDNNPKGSIFTVEIPIA
ncbi:PAS domain-containing sensor histidine kinase [Dissulfurispira thermophila]|uniref:histidine kinase n=2 Tax=root TaxID=1 RepID=A0A7G1H597_9BACT|nr:ATP-binding protein [Dissulfurispira thermophila]BCB97096.1 PAS domain-containing sensor histidine kinase [Dissulfurispira thermophila]